MQEKLRRTMKGKLALICVLAIAWGVATASDRPKRLSAAQIQVGIIGHTVTDEADWSDSYLPDGTLKDTELGRTRQSSWRIKGRELCLTRQTKRPVEECYEVWLSGNAVEFRRDGVTVLSGKLKDE